MKEKVNPGVGSEELAQQLTQAGLTVDRLQPVAEPFSGVVTARVSRLKAHTEKLSLCTVEDGDQSYTVLCGAPNVAAGALVAFARPGAWLAGLGEIAAKEIQRVTSFGMLCSEAELGLSDDHQGILLLPEDTPVGVNLWDWLQLDDHILHLDLNSNRPDCLSVVGVAREVASINGLTMEMPAQQPVAPTIPDACKVILNDQAGCPKYLGRVIKGVNIAAETPYWLKEKLRRSNIRSFHPVVDVTNYVMRELGQPLHAFDFNNLNGDIEVRKAYPGESLVLLNGQTVVLKESSLLIVDSSGPIALAGIMGGLNTAIKTDASEPTTDIFLECAYFSPLAIRGQAKLYGLATDAAQCYERGVDFELQARAMEQATRMLLDIAGGEAGPVVTELAEKHLPNRPEISLRLSRLKKVLALDLGPSELLDILQRLNFEVQATLDDEDAYQVTPPSYRCFDIHDEVDLIEEVARLHGYDKVPYETPVFQTKLDAVFPFDPLPDRLVNLGYHEVITYAFINRDEYRQISPHTTPVELQNPSIVGRSVMRASLLPGLLSVCNYNQNRQQKRMRLFETGCVFEYADGGELLQREKVAGLISGGRWPESWNQSKEPVDFYDLKGDLEQLMAPLSQSLQWSTGSHPALHPKQSAVISMEGKEIGFAGRLHPKIEAKLDIRNAVYLFEVDKDNNDTIIRPVQTKSISPFPAIRRDIALVVNRQVSASQLMDRIRVEAGVLLVELNLFDLYEGSEIDSNKRSLALSLVFQSMDRSLLESEVESIIKQVLAVLKDDYKAQQRT